MNIKLKPFFILIALFFLGLTTALIFLTIQLRENSHILSEMRKDIVVMIVRSDQLRQSSDDLTRLARTYVVTGNEEYKINYLETLKIRHGHTLSPKSYFAIYWDLSKVLRETRHPEDKSVTLIDEINKLPYSEYELSQLNEAYRKSIILSVYEKEAFSYLDVNSTAKIDKEGNAQYLAIAMLHSSHYKKMKEDVMLPIDKFWSSLIERVGTKQSDIKKQIKKSLVMLISLLIFTFVVLVISIYIIHRKVLTPISHLTQSILSFQKGKEEQITYSYYDDEIGMMAEEFFSMKKKLSEDLKTMERLASTDPLTKINNRRIFFEIAIELLHLSKRTNAPLSLMILDLDHFKKINDKHGHLVGDEILKHFTHIVKKALRESDVFARYGGEEFIILLPDTNITGSVKTAEKIRQQIVSNPYSNKKTFVDYTVSIGTTQYTDERTIEAIVDKADKALYKAKESGRNSVNAG
ncbi:MAG: GGDEF domain-containing protein [Bacteroidales bacterium]|nr:GGDEF domain-containing protein [Bacteroidales bacterium]